MSSHVGKIYDSVFCSFSHLGLVIFYRKILFVPHCIHSSSSLQQGQVILDDPTWNISGEKQHANTEANIKKTLKLDENQCKSKLSNSWVPILPRLC